MVKPRAARTGADLCTEEMRRGGDSTGNPRKQFGRRMVQWARVGEQTRVVVFSEASHFNGFHFHYYCCSEQRYDRR
jgi:hypothetical protein